MQWFQIQKGWILNGKRKYQKQYISQEVLKENDAAKFQSSCVDLMEKFQSNKGSICFYGKHIISFTYNIIKNIYWFNVKYKECGEKQHPEF